MRLLSDFALIFAYFSWKQTEVFANEWRFPLLRFRSFFKNKLLFSKKSKDRLSKQKFNLYVFIKMAKYETLTDEP